MVIKATAFWSEQGQGRLEETTLSPPKEGEALVRTAFTGISKGTELLVFQDRVPDTEGLRMRAPFQEGSFGGAVKYGYCNVGWVEDGPADWIDRPVFCLYPHQDRYVVPLDALRPLPQTLPLGRAVLAANMETAVNGIADAGLDQTTPSPAQNVTVIGAGVVGCLVAYLAHQHGHHVEVIDIDPSKRAVVEALGLSFAKPDQALSERQVMIHTSATEAGLIHALNLAGLEGLIIEMSWFGTTRPALPLGEAFHAKRLTLRSSQVGHIAPNRANEWDYAKRFDVALAALHEPKLDQLITHESPFAKLPQVMAGLADCPEVLCHRIVY